MTSGRKASGPEPVNITAATKVTATEKAELVKQYGSMYAALRAGISLLLGKR